MGSGTQIQQTILPDLHKIFRHSPEIEFVCTLPEGRVEVCSERAARFFRCEPAELVGRTLEELLEGYRENPGAELRQYLLGLPGKLGGDAGGEWITLAREGKKLPVYLTGYPLDGLRPGVEYAVVRLRPGQERAGGAPSAGAPREVTEASRPWENLAVAVVQTATDAIYTYTPEGTVLSWNASAERLFGYAAAEVVGHSLPTIIPEDKREEFQAALERVKSGQSVTALETVRHRRSGQKLEVSLMLSPVYDPTGKLVAISSVARDVTAKHLAQKALQRSEAKFQQLADSIPQIVWRADGQGNWNFVNRGWFEFTGEPAERALGQGWRVAVHPDDVLAVEQAFSRVRPGSGCKVSCRLRRGDGRYRWFLLRAIPLHGGGSTELEWYGTCTDIQEQVTAQEETRRSEARLRHMIQSAPVGIAFCRISGMLIEANDAFLSQVGYGRDLLTVGLTRQALVAPEDRERDETAVQELRGTGSFHSRRLHLIRSDGQRVPVLVSGNLLEGTSDEYVIFSVDLTEQLKVEQALRDSEERFRDLADSMPQIVWGSRPDGFIDYYNGKWFEYTGLTPEEIQGDVWARVIHPEDLELTRAAWKRSLESGGPCIVEHRLRSAQSGKYRWHLVRVLPVRDRSGEVVRWFGTSTDIHSIKMVEERLRAADRKKDEFLATVSHELRTPLNVIQGYAQLLEILEPGSAEFRSAVDKILNNVRAQTQLISDLLDVSRIITGKLKLDITTFEIREAVLSAVDSVRFAAEAKQIELITEIDPSLGRICGDESRIQQIVWNLLSNGVKFTPPRGKIRVSVDRVDTLVRVRVQDSGKGMSRESLEHVFNRLWQEDAGFARKHGGMGLGLAIVRHLTEMHGGTVTASSAGIGKGSCFTVMLPIQVLAAEPEPDEYPEYEAAAEKREQLPPAEALDLGGLRILCVDDQPDARDILTKALVRYGACVRTAASGQDALRLLREEAADLILCDIGMPGMNGYELFRKVRALESGRGRSEAPVIALTAFAGKKNADEALAHGFCAHLSKPVDLNVLSSTIHRVVMNRYGGLPPQPGSLGNPGEVVEQGGNR